MRFSLNHLLLTSLATFGMTATATPTPSAIDNLRPETIAPDNLRPKAIAIDHITPANLEATSLTKRDSLAVYYCYAKSGTSCSSCYYESYDTNSHPSCWAFSTPVQCMSAEYRVYLAFCGTNNCSGQCNYMNNCGTMLDRGYCYTPGTNSFQVGVSMQIPPNN
ncbi:hypothetical protein DFP72DRAFT_1170759 [Ephemerocybe angulata]|uniref:Uncharacterized protein n=1 Tax=Ephemerocybe angulata TaxID=980116 RepID=A0A8H6HVP7_9AGAR|nr:hypothetical protein DFP72DRAFT_1170759 [Tulosesus angulatus]